MRELELPEVLREGGEDVCDREDQAAYAYDGGGVVALGPDDGEGGADCHHGDC